MARVPYGYVRLDDGWQLDPDQAAVVGRIFSEFTRPYLRAGLTEIAHDLNADGIPTQRGGKWHASTVKYILSNAGYVGGAQPAIISQEVYDQAQARLNHMQMGPTR